MNPAAPFALTLFDPTAFGPAVTRQAAGPFATPTLLDIEHTEPEERASRLAEAAERRAHRLATWMFSTDRRADESESAWFRRLNQLSAANHTDLTAGCIDHETWLARADSIIRTFCLASELHEGVAANQPFRADQFEQIAGAVWERVTRTFAGKVVNRRPLPIHVLRFVRSEARSTLARTNRSEQRRAAFMGQMAPTFRLVERDTAATFETATTSDEQPALALLTLAANGTPNTRLSRDTVRLVHDHIEHAHNGSWQNVLDAHGTGRLDDTTTWLLAAFTGHTDDMIRVVRLVGSVGVNLDIDAAVAAWMDLLITELPQHGGNLWADLGFADLLGHAPTGRPVPNPEPPRTSRPHHVMVATQIAAGEQPPTALTTLSPWVNHPNHRLAVARIASLPPFQARPLAVPAAGWAHRVLLAAAGTALSGGAVRKPGNGSAGASATFAQLQSRVAARRTPAPV